jgi:hypothetical protein
VILGKFRGLQIDNQYKLGEWQMDITSQGFTMLFNGTLYQTGVLWPGSSLGHVHLRIDTGVHAGSLLRGYYTTAQGMNVEYVLIAFGANANDDPTGWDTPWINGGSSGSEYVWTKISQP